MNKSKIFFSTVILAVSVIPILMLCNVTGSDVGGSCNLTDARKLLSDIQKRIMGIDQYSMRVILNQKTGGNKATADSVMKFTKPGLFYFKGTGKVVMKSGDTNTMSIYTTVKGGRPDS